MLSSGNRYLPITIAISQLSTRKLLIVCIKARPGGSLEIQEGKEGRNVFVTSLSAV